MDEYKIAAGIGIIACGDSAKSLDVMEEHFDQVALLVQHFVVTSLRLAVLGPQENGADAAVLEFIDNPCG